MKDYRIQYKKLARAKQATAEHMLQYAILKGMEYGGTNDEIMEWAQRFIRRAFTQITNKKLLDNGRLPYDTVEKLLDRLAWIHHDGSVLGVSPGEALFDSTDEYDTYKAIINGLRLKYATERTAERHYVYIFVRQDLYPEYQAVQACHAAAKMGHRHGEGGIEQAKFDELYFALIGVPNMAGLATAMADAKEVGAVVYPFYEPDIGGVMTSFATSPIPSNKRKRLLSYKKLRFE